MLRTFRLVVLPALALVALILQSQLSYAQWAVLVRVDPVKTEPLVQTVPVLGRLIAQRAGNVASRISGAVEEIRVETGDRVSKGQILALLDSETLKTDVDLAESELQNARIDLKTEQAQAKLSLADFERQKKLKRSAAFSQVRFDQAQRNLLMADARVDRAKAQIAIRTATLKKARLSLEHATIRAPYDGVVVRSFTEKGAYVRNGEPVVRLLDDNSLEIEANVPANRLSGLTAGRIISFTLERSDKHYKASVRAALPAENSLTRTRTVFFTPKFDKAATQLAEGQSVSVEIPAGAERSVLTVHKDAILKRGGEVIVYVVQGETVRSQAIALGEGVNGRFQVLNGLKKGDVVVVQGNERLKPGRKIRIDKGAS